MIAKCYSDSGSQTMIKSELERWKTLIEKGDITASDDRRSP
jgi:hypothetical protein